MAGSAYRVRGTGELDGQASGGGVTMAQTDDDTPIYQIRTDLDPNRVLLDDDDWTLKGRPRCIGRRTLVRGGGRCHGFAGYSGYCAPHDPVFLDEKARTEHPLRGHVGNKLMRLMPPRLRPVFERLVVAMNDVVDGNITPSQATALAALATASVRVLQMGELEERLRALDAATVSDGEALSVEYIDD